MNGETKHPMTTTFLSDQDRGQVQMILASYGLSGFDASVRLWGRGKAIDVHGTLGQQELSCLLAIARFLANQSANDQDAADARAAASAAPPLPLCPPSAAGLPAT